MLKVLINEEEVVANQNFTINKHMLNTPSVILNNVCPKSWCDNKNYAGFYHPLDYSKCKIMDIPTAEEKIGQYQKITTLGTITNVDSTKENEITQLDGLTTQSGTPTPSTPQPINVVSGEQEINVCGKNLYNKDVFVQGTWQSSSPSNRIVGFLTPTKAGQKYRVTLRNNELDFAIGNTTKNVQSGNTQAQSDSGWQSTDYTYTITGDGYLFLQVKKRYGGNLTPSDLSATDFQVELGETGTAFEEYKGNSYEINLGKNLFDKDNANILNNVYIGSSTLGISNGAKTLYIPIQPTTTYTVSKILSARFTICTTSDIPASNVSIIDRIGNNSATSLTLTASAEAKYLCVFYYLSSADTLTEEEIRNSIQIEKGSQATSYSPYKEPIELCKIGDYQDFIKKGTGKNLFKPFNFTKTSNGITFTYSEDGYINVNNTSIGNALSMYTSEATPYLIELEAGTYVVSGYTNDIRLEILNSSGTALCNTGTTNTFTLTETTSVFLRANILSGKTFSNVKIFPMIEKGNTATSYEPYGMYNKWYIEKNISKVVLDGSENWSGSGNTGDYYRFSLNISEAIASSLGYSNYFTYNANYTLNEPHFYIASNKNFWFFSNNTNTANFKTWLSTHNTTVYYILNTPTYTEITDSELISQLNAIQLLSGLNNITISSPYLSTPITFRYNYWLDKLLFCGVVKNSGKISLNPREPHYTTLQILDFKDFLSTGETLDYVIYQKTILEAIQQVISSISDYGFILGNVNILNPDDIIGAYSTKDKTAYDVFNYIADITQSRWTTRMINENQVAIDFYDPTLMPEGTEIDYTDTFFKTNLIDDMTYKYGTNNYRNKQVMISNQVIGNLAQIQTFTSNGYQNQYIVDLPVAEIQKVYVNGEEKTFASYQEYELGINADFYYTVNSNIIESENILATSSRIEIYYIPIIEGRQVIVDEDEISRINTSTGRKGIVSRYEQRNDATTSLELQKIGESYIKYKGTSEIVLTIKSRTNIWEVGQKVQFNAPINELNTTYMVRTKKIEYISSINTLFYTYELVSSFNSETEINYFDNQRAKSKGNIGDGDGEYISRNIDIENTADIIFYDTTAVEMTLVGDNVLDSVLNSPFTN